jgi:S1-C subfamily serine protease
VSKKIAPHPNPLPASRSEGTKQVRFVVLAAACMLSMMVSSAQADDLYSAIRHVQPKIVKLHGAGGYKGLEPYQSGFLFSPDGHVLTVWSYVLDTDYVTATLADGRRMDAKLVAADPRLEIAVLKLDATDLPYFNLAESVVAEVGTRVLAFSNLFGIAVGDEPASVLHGIVAAKTRLNARRGTFESPYDGPIYVLDAMTNNPGSAGGALVDDQGHLLGLLGKELRHTQSNLWLNFALPTAEIAATAEAMRAGTYVRRTADEQKKPKLDRPLTLDLLGLVLVPDVLERTPPYVDAVVVGSSAAAAGILPDDVVLFVNDRLTQSCRAVRNELESIHRVDPVKITLLRKQQLIEITLRAKAESGAERAP